MLNEITSNPLYKGDYFNFLEIFLCVILLSGCSFGPYQEDRCRLNGNLGYLNTTPLAELNLPEDLDVILPISYDDYVVPVIKKFNSSTQKVGKQLNICPPSVLSTDILHESCLINIED
ncbi:outer membrane protein assembly factor BamC [Blochmannia endosymbiont of Camponotus nipponensis]|uniref:outer membrane protein assembly factor BamC n=1 Tax=Blochmannia endosymbiont of Camponotus nipponensis TaxID=2681986 RepID=UPI001358BC93|nr:outer membrane protein assembly factor BamC [Blochmannia endosymbiont of Camponotus nipponensis]